MNELPDPKKQAAQLREQFEDGGFGVAHDAVVEARIDADWMHQRCLRMAADLDGMLDDLGMFPSPIHTAIFEARQRVQESAEWAERFADALEEEQRQLVEEHDE